MIRLPESQAPGADDLQALNREIVNCRCCPRLVEWREQVATQKRAAYVDAPYWGRPITGFGDTAARLLILGLAPAAHGANRTGRLFTGDRSGDWLFRALHRAGYANQPTSSGLDDGLRLHDAFVTAAVRCAPPANKPTPLERNTCRPFLERELRLLKNLKVVVVLGQFAYDQASRVLAFDEKPKFGHLVETRSGSLSIVCSYHPSQQNTFTGKLTQAMLDEVFLRSRSLS